MDAYYEQLPENELFVLGDNHHYSDDSRDPLIGIISMDMVVGKTSFV